MNRLLIVIFALQSVLFGQDPLREYQARERERHLLMAFAIRIEPDIPDRELTETPNPTSQTLPEFPIELRAEGVTGAAKISLTVDVTGAVSNLKIVKDTQKEFGDAALAAAKTWRFTPGRNKQGPVAVMLSYEIAFEFPMNDAVTWITPWGHAQTSPMQTPALRAQQARNEAARSLFEAAVLKKLSVGDTLDSAKAILREAGIRTDLRQGLRSSFHAKYDTGPGCGFSIYLDYDDNERITKIKASEIMSIP